MNDRPVISVLNYSALLVVRNLSVYIPTSPMTRASRPESTVAICADREGGLGFAKPRVRGFRFMRLRFKSRFEKFMARED